MAKLESGEIFYWGGFYYGTGQRMLIDGFNLLNEEEGLSKNGKIVDFQMGFCHDLVLTEE